MRSRRPQGPGCLRRRAGQGTNLDDPEQDGKPVRFEITEATPLSLERWIHNPEMFGLEFLWPSRIHGTPHLSTRHYARMVRGWVMSVGLEPSAYGTHSMRRTKVAQVCPIISVPEAPWALQLAQDRADVDISDPAFDFVRSIRVLEITYQQRRNSDGDCNSWGSVYMGSYGDQGDYSRQRSGMSAVPPASDFDIPAGCGSYWHRSVFVDWRDYEGTYGHKEVHY